MADLGGTFDPGAVSDDRETLPAGEALGQIFESELPDNSKGTGKILKLGWEILEGVNKGRKLWSQHNVQNANAQAQEIGQRELKRICDAAGTGPIRDSSVLHFKPMVISWIVKPAEVKDGKSYDAKNEIKGWRRVGGSVAPPSGTVTQAQPNTTAEVVKAASPSVPWPSRT